MARVYFGWFQKSRISVASFVTVAELSPWDFIQEMNISDELIDFNKYKKSEVEEVLYGYISKLKLKPMVQKRIMKTLQYCHIYNKYSMRFYSGK